MGWLLQWIKIYRCYGFVCQFLPSYVSVSWDIKIFAARSVIMEEIGKSMEKKAEILNSIPEWSIRDSNPWPQQCECCALPTALMPLKWIKADNGSRTRLSGLGSQCSTDEPYLHVPIIALLDFYVKLLRKNFIFPKMKK